MREENEQQLLEEIAQRFHHDRVILNNPVVMQGMGLAPLVIVATTVENAWLLVVAVALLLAPSRIIASVIFRRVHQPFYRAAGYTFVAALVYIAMYFLMQQWFGTKVLLLGIYLPMLVVEPLIIYRFGRVQEPLYKACFKSLRMTIGYAVILLILGSVREVLSHGTIYGHEVMFQGALPVAALPAGGFILLGTICALWRAGVNRYRKHVVMEAKREK